MPSLSTTLARLAMDEHRIVQAFERLFDAPFNRRTEKFLRLSQKIRMSRSRAVQWISRNADGTIANRALRDTSKAYASISNLALRTSRAQDPAAVLDLTSQRAAAGNPLLARSLLQRRFRSGLVRVVGSGGRTFSYGLGSFLTLVFDAAEAKMRTQTVLARATSRGDDLVRISPNKSKIGDWCDAYRGKVFSISGTDPRFFPLSTLPNGGPPFHPHCKHTLSTFRPGPHSAEQLTSFAQVRKDFLITSQEDDINKIARAWRKR